MKRVELELEHRYKNRFVGRHRLKSNDYLTVIGSSRDANIRLLGEEVSGVHALIEFDDNKWTISDAGSEQGTWIKRKPIVFHEIHGSTQVRIGGHDLKIVPKVIESDIFTSKTSGDTTKELQDVAELEKGTYHQVVVRKIGYVMHTEILPAGKDFEFSYGGEKHSLPAPPSSEWLENEFGEIKVQQRLVTSGKIAANTKERVRSILDPELRVPLASAAFMLLLVFTLIGLAPDKPEEKLEELKPDQNRYTRMIYDAKSVRKKRMQAKELRSTMSKQNRQIAAQNSSAKNTVVQQSKEAAPKVVSRIKAAGLSQLLGKISKRAAKNANFIRAQGRTPDSTKGRAYKTAGSLESVAKASGSSGKTYKVAGIGTAGKAGSSTAYKGVGGLAAGNVGNASVGILEEETEIQGGLDREVISQVIKSQLGQIRYCYERQLSARPDLYGKVMVKFTIGAAGSVVTQAVGLSTLNSAMVEGCILRRVASWRFPKPKGGTSVLVTYPFLFKSTN